jgi:hypothetical protein
VNQSWTDSVEKICFISVKTVLAILVWTKTIFFTVLVLTKTFFLIVLVLTKMFVFNLCNVSLHEALSKDLGLLFSPSV